MVEKIAIIENKEQAKEFLRRKKEFEDFLPITFSYEAEEFFLDNNVKFKMEEDYETEGIYEGLYNSSLNTTNELCKEIKFYYREIELFELFYQDLLIFVGNNQKYLKILEKINKIEKPDKVVIFQEERKNPNKEICSKLAKEFFKKKGKKITYSCKKKKKLNNFINFAGIIQKKISKIILSFSMKKNFIFFIDGKQRSEFLLKELLKNKEKLFRCHNRLQKGFFVGKEYIPFYQFSGKESIHQKELLIRISKMLEREKFYFLKKIFFDKIILLRLKEWIAYYIQYKFIEISFIINDLINFMGNKKINAIIVYADTPTFEKTFVKAGKLFKIPTFVLQHGMAGYELGFYPFSADYFIAFGEESKHRLKNFGLPEEKVFALGHPQFEKYLNQRTKRTKIISYITTTARSTDFLPEVDPSKKNQKDILRIIFRAMKNFPKYKLIVKGREGWDMNNLAKQIAKEENFHNFEVVEKTDSSKLLRNSDVLLVNNSTMVLDALLLKKDVISVTCKGISHFYNSPFTKPIKKVFDEKQLGKEIRKCLGRNKNYPNFLEKRLPKEWGGSSKKISEFISSKIG